MNQELYRPATRAIIALFLIVLIKIVAMLTLRDVVTAYSVMNVVLSIAVVLVLLRFGLDFNRQLGISKPDFPEAQSFVTGIVLLLVILTLYGTFLPYADTLPYRTYNILFFILALIPVYTLWNILTKHAERLSQLLLFISQEEKPECSCGFKNPASADFCNRCGLSLQRGDK
jgi:hypothetical protein